MTDIRQKMMGTRAVSVVLLWAAAASVGLARGDEDVRFNRDVRPILANYCYECHGPDDHSRKGDLRLDQFAEATEGAIVPGKPEESPLIQRMMADDREDRMPPPESPRQPTLEHIEILRRWIAQGAPYEEHWAYRPTRREAPSIHHDSPWIRNEIDAWVWRRLQDEGLKPQPDAEPAVLARRLSLALTGLPILPDASLAFEDRYGHDPDSAVDQFVDGLLASEAYGEHFAWAWLNAARYADTNGYQGDGPRIMWPWRDWLVSALNQNLPYDQLTERMLAGDLMLPEIYQNWKSGDWIPDAEASELLTATGFLRNHRYDSGSGTIPAEAKFENAADRLETVGTVWLGMTLQCARCHTHKFDPIEQREYYQLLSFFDNVPEVGEALKQASHPYIHTPSEEQRSRLNALVQSVAKASIALEDAEAAIADEQRQWERRKATELDDGRDSHLRMVRGLRHRYAVEPITLNPSTELKQDNRPIELCVGNRPWTLSFWFRPEVAEDGSIFSSIQEPERYRQGIQADWVDGRIRVRHVSRWVNSYIEFVSRETLESNRWYHVTLRCDGRIQGLGYRSWLNGREADMICTHEVANNSGDRSGNAPLVLGRNAFLPGVRGQLRDLRFYDRDLSAVEVASLAEPRSTSLLARIPEGDRTSLESRMLRLAFLDGGESSPWVAGLWKARLDAEAVFREVLSQTPTTMVMRDVDLGPTKLHAMGAYDQPTVPVEPSTPRVLPTMVEGRPRDRLALARWLTRPDHPLTARVAVNRIWQTLWGHGFVDSPENFGTQCPEPEYSELLDWLANEYVRLGWDTKALIKRIVTSRTYRQRLTAPAELWARDPENRWLARGPRFRLPVQVIRDQALVLSGRLDPTVGGPPIILDQVLGKDGKPVELDYDVNNHRRTLYTFWKRNAPHPMLAVYDVADRNQCDVRTRRTNTPLQALVTLNEPGLAACAMDLGRRAREVGETDRDRLEWIWRACTGRAPDSKQSTELEAALDRYHRMTEGDLDTTWAALANVLLNLDATLTLE